MAREERYELGSQVRRSSNSSPTQLAEKHDDRHIRNKLESVNRNRGEAGETIHHLFIAKLRSYINETVYRSYRSRYNECIRMLNGLARSLEKRPARSTSCSDVGGLPEANRRWPPRDELGDQDPEP